MTLGIILVAAVIFLCILADKFSARVGMPALILFMFIGMLFGSDGILKIPFDDFKLAENICSVALLFIMFYGGFNTKWKLAKCVVTKAVMLSTLGVAITAGLTALLCRLCLHFSVLESFLIGAVLSSTDAASVFSILRQKKLNLRDGTASLLEIESGSNDPMSYMLTILAIGMLKSAEGIHNIPYFIFSQLFFGILLGAVFACIAVWLMNSRRLIPDGLDTVFLTAVVLLCFGVCSYVGGNQYLAVYFMGIIVGNRQIPNKKMLIPFFDGITGLAQIILFFLLGFLAFPHLMPPMILPAVFITIVLTFIARPVAVFVLMLPFKCSIRQCLLVSWAGLRGAASIVFSIMVLAHGVEVSYDLYHIVLMVAFFSVAIQGTCLPLVSSVLGMVDESADVRKTFNDYQEESAITLMKMDITPGHNWENKCVREISVPTGSLAIMIKRGQETIIPKGDTKIHTGDCVILSVPAYESGEGEHLEEIFVDRAHAWCNHPIKDLQLGEDELITMVIRGDENLIPDGETVILENDIVVTFR